MKKYINLTNCLFLIGSFAFLNTVLAESLNAQNVKVIGEKAVTIETGKIDAKNTFKINSKNNTEFDAQQDEVNSQKGSIKLLDVEISDNFKKEIIKRANKLLFSNIARSQINSFAHENSRIDPNSFNVELGMGNVPVMDQGSYGTCATFAATAAIDALFNLGDYISQQCLLEVGLYKYYFYQTYAPGWDGGYVSNALGRMKYYGIVKHDNCPHSYPNDQEWMFPFTYKKHSLKETWVKNISWQKIRPANIEDIKRSLKQGKRVVISNLLYLRKAAGYPVNGSQNGYWRLPTNENEIAQMMDDLLWIPNYTLAGHALVVTGYNDADKVLKLRNSWGQDNGDNGEFYMSYDYYRLLNYEAIEVENNLYQFY